MKRITFLITALISMTSQAAFVAIVKTPKAPSITENLSVTQNGIVGTFSVKNSELITDTIITKEGCAAFLEGNLESSGDWTYYNSIGCSDDDEIEFKTTNGLTEIVKLWSNAKPCYYTKNGWLQAAYDGTFGLIYNKKSCSINGSSLLSLSSYDSVPAFYLDSIYIDIMGGGPSMFIEGFGEGDHNQEFNLPEIQFVFGNIIIDHPFLEKLDLSNLRSAGSTIILRGMQYIKSFDLSKLSGNEYSINVMGAMTATELDISNVYYGPCPEICVITYH